MSITVLCRANLPGNSSGRSSPYRKSPRTGQPIVLKSRGEQVRSFCYVQDAVDALLLLLDKGVPGEAYNVANRMSVASIREFTFPILIGMLAGVYSSMLLSGQIWATWMDRDSLPRP